VLIGTVDDDRRLTSRGGGQEVIEGGASRSGPHSVDGDHPRWRSSRLPG